jgi:MoaA/NifB/PqqE/SkfB family radical SAM enzyme
MTIFSRLFPARSQRIFSAWQVEITTRCPLRCIMCVKEGCRTLTYKDMEVEDFRALSPYFSRVRNIVLEGWGESLMHGHLAECIRIVKAAGARAGFVTSGSGLTESYAREILAAGVDFVGFSLSGATAETHSRIRVNSDFDHLLWAIRLLKRLASDKGKDKPAIHIVYLMLQENIDEIPLMMDLAASLCVEEVLLIHMVQVTDASQDRSKAFTCQGESPYRELLARARARADKLGIHLALPSLMPRDVAVCGENPLENLYISVDGLVSPCVYLHPPVASPFPRIYCGTEYPTETVSFGNVLHEPFDDIWESDAYRQFRGHFMARRKEWRDVQASLLFERRFPDNAPLPDPPLPCKTCHKMLGF